MIIPVRCFSCGKVIGAMYEEYVRLTEQGKMSSKEALDAIHLDRYCCRRMILSHVDLVDEVLGF